MASLPYGFMPPGTQREIVGELYVRAEADPEVRAMLVAGSFARGDALSGSDLDLYFILQDGVHRPFSARMERGVWLECTCFDRERALAKMRGKLFSLYTFLDGRALFDDGVAGELKGVAESILTSYHPDSSELDGLRIWLESACVKVRAATAARDELRRAYVVSTTSYEALRGIYLVNSRPIPPSGGVLHHLRNLQELPPMAMIETMFVGDLCGRAESFLRLSEWLLARIP